MAKALADLDPMPFGKYRGYKMCQISARYLDWLRDQDWVAKKYPEVLAYIDENASRIDHELEQGG